MKNINHDRRKAGILLFLLLLSIPINVFATSEVVSRINSLQSLVMGIITAAGAIVLAWGVFDFAAGYQAHDTSQQTQSLKKVVAGILMLLAQSVVDMLS